MLGNNGGLSLSLSLPSSHPAPPCVFGNCRARIFHPSRQLYIFQTVAPQAKSPSKLFMTPIEAGRTRAPIWRSAMDLFVGHRSSGDRSGGDCSVNLRCRRNGYVTLNSNDILQKSAF